MWKRKVPDPERNDFSDDTVTWCVLVAVFVGIILLLLGRLAWEFGMFS